MAAGKERWATRIGLILAVAGNAVGLGNFLRFPAQAVENGGGVFIIPYLVSFVLMGIPMLWIEWGLGRRGGKYGHHSTPGMLDTLGKSRIMKYFGVFGIFTNLAVAAYYCYIESWTLAYVWHSIRGVFEGLSPDQVTQFFNDYLAKGGDTFFNISTIAIIFFVITLVINIFILSRGLSKGIEVTSKILVPILILFGIFLAIRTVTLDAGEMGAVNDAVKGLNFLWEPQFSSLADPKVWLAAAGQVFFTLSVGMGTILCYAAYVEENQDIALNSTTAGFTNEFVEIVLGGSIIIPLGFAYLGDGFLQSIASGEIGGFEITFVTIPALFQNWGPFLAAVAGVLWFGLLFFAGITSSLAMGQPVVAFMEDAFDWGRRKSSVIFGVVILILAIPAVILYEKGAFDEFDYWAGTFSLVVFALGESILFAWYYGIDKAWTEINRGADIKIPEFFKYILKYVTPSFILAVFLGSLFTPQGGDWGAAFSSLFGGNGWPLGSGSIIGKILQIGVEDPDVIMVTNGVRILLLVVFVAISVLIAYAWKIKYNKEKEMGGIS